MAIYMPCLSATFYVVKNGISALAARAIAKWLLPAPHFPNKSDGPALRSRKTNERFHISAAARYPGELSP